MMWITYLATTLVILLYALVVLLVAGDRIPAVKFGPWQYPVENALLIVVNALIGFLGLVLSKLVARGVYTILVQPEASVLMDSSVFDIATRTIWDRSWGLLGQELQGKRDGRSKKEDGKEGGTLPNTLSLTYLLLLLVIDVMLGLQTGSFLSRTDPMEGGRDPDYFALALGGGTASEKARTLFNYIQSQRKSSSGSGTLPQAGYDVDLDSHLYDEIAVVCTTAYNTTTNPLPGPLRIPNTGSVEPTRGNTLLINTNGVYSLLEVQETPSGNDLFEICHARIKVGESGSYMFINNTLIPVLSDTSIISERLQGLGNIALRVIRPDVQEGIKILRWGTQDSLHMVTFLQILADVVAYGRAGGINYINSPPTSLETDTEITGTTKIRREKLVIGTHVRYRHQQQQEDLRVSTSSSTVQHTSAWRRKANVPLVMRNDTSWNVMSSLANVGETAGFRDAVGVAKCKSQLEEARLLKAAFISGEESAAQADEGITYVLDYLQEDEQDHEGLAQMVLLAGRD
ncbi:hypothetical protein HK102_013608 [Quaeritorhiza haematococci]|nr:hypothetical protein HK102_013608 [Quaeritorhiza haematococci]